MVEKMPFDVAGDGLVAVVVADDDACVALS